VLIRGAVGLALRAGVPTLVVALTIVSLGTSSPEIAVSVDAAVSGRGGLSVGNVVGSNIFNVLVVLGGAALVVPLIVEASLVRVHVPVMIGASFLLLGFAADGALRPWEGALLVAGGVVYLAFQAIRVRAEGGDAPAGGPAVDLLEVTGVGPRGGAGGVLSDLLFLGVGITLLVLGAGWVVDGAVVFARAVGVSDLIVGLTVVAAGTSLPEVATSLLAALRGQREIAVGNAVGSNILNLSFVLGPAALAAGSALPVPPSAVAFDLPVMTAVAIACLPVFFTGSRISRWEGTVFLGYYAVYTLFLYLQTSRHDSAEAFGFTVLAFVLPLTLFALGVVVFREFRARSR